MEPPFTNGAPTIEITPAATTNREETRLSAKTLLNPELLQPSIIAISITYVVYAIGALYNLNQNIPAETQFSYYVTSIGLISAILFYTRYAFSNETYVSFMDLVYMLIASLAIGAYITHWFITPNSNKLPRPPMPAPDPNPGGHTAPKELYNGIYSSSCIDKKKCSQPLHLVLQSAYMLCIVLSLVFSIIRRG